MKNCKKLNKNILRLKRNGISIVNKFKHTNKNMKKYTYNTKMKNFKEIT
jgi:hypothetical protein